MRAHLETVRTAIRKAIPGAEEVISYKIPAYRLPQGVVIWFACWKRHYSLYPATEYVVSALSEELAPYEVKNGTIRFPLDARVPRQADRKDRRAPRGRSRGERQGRCVRKAWDAILR